MHYTFKQIKEANLLSDERIKELSHLLETLPYHPFDKNGKEIKNLMIAPTKKGDCAFIINGNEFQVEYMHREVLSNLLTEDEIELINSNYTHQNRQSRFEYHLGKAKIVDAKDWKGGVFWDERYFETVQDLMETLEDTEDKDNWPEYVYSAMEKQVIEYLDTEDVLESQIVENGWEDMCDDDLNGIEELQSALDKFVEINKNVVSYQENNSIVIKL